MIIFLTLTECTTDVLHLFLIWGISLRQVAKNLYSQMVSSLNSKQYIRVSSEILNEVVSFV